MLASKAILDLFTNNLCSGERRANVSWRGGRVPTQLREDLPPMRKLGNNPGRLCDMAGSAMEEEERNPFWAW